MKTLVIAFLFSALLSHGAALPEFKDLPTQPDQARFDKPKPADFRVVNGELYNTLRSTNWMTVKGNVRGVASAGTPVKVYEVTQPEPTRPMFGQSVVIKNIPNKDKLVEGSPVVCRMMIVGTVQHEGKQVLLCDYGLPNTQENRKGVNPAVANAK